MRFESIHRLSKVLKSVLAICAVATFGSTVQAQSTYTWNLNANGTWDTSTANFLLSGSPAAWVNGNNVAVFGNALTANRTVAIGAGGVTAGTLTFENTGTFLYSLGTIGNNITLNGPGGTDTINVNSGVVGTSTYAGTGGHSITNSNLTFTNNLSIVNNGAFGTTSLTIAGNISRAAAGGNVSFSGQGNTHVSGAIGNTITGGITKSGSGTVVLSSSSNAFTGNVTINGGVLAINSSDAMLGAVGNQVNINNSGTFRFNNTLSTGRTFNVAGNAGIDLNSGVTATLSGTGSLAGSGNLNVTLTGGTTAGILSIEGANAGFTGSITVGGGMRLVGHVATQRVFASTDGSTLRLQGSAGALANASSITINQGSGLTITQSTTATTGRLGSAALNFNGARFLYNPSANGGTQISDTFGNVVAVGQNVFTASSTAGPATGTILNFGTLDITGRPTFYLRANTTGSTSLLGNANDTLSSGSVNLKFSGMTNSGGSGTSRNVVPWATYSNGPTGSFVGVAATYDSNGFRPLAASEQAAFTTSLATVAGLNATGGGTVATNGSVNSMKITTSSSFNTAGTVGIASGWMGVDASTTFNGATLAFGSTTGYIHMSDTMTFSGSSSITGTGGLVISSGLSTSFNTVAFANTAANTFSGGLWVNGLARVRFNANNQLGQDGGGNNSGTLTLGGGQLIHNSAGTVNLSDGANHRAVVVNAANGTIGSSTAGGILQIAGNISGSGQLQFGGGLDSSATGVVELTNTSANSYTGGTVVSAGILRISNANQLGSGAVFLNGGTLQASGTLNFSSAPTAVLSGTIDTQANNITLAGGLNGSGGTGGTSATSLALTKNGTGTLTISGAGNYAGSLTMSALGGTVTMNGNGKLPELGAVSVGRSGILNIDNSSVNLADRTGRTTAITLTNNGTTGGATLNLTTNVAGSTFNFGGLTVSGGAAGNLNTSFINVLDGGSGNNVITFESLTAIATNNLLQVVGSANLGKDTVGGSRIFFRNAPTLTGGIVSNLTFTGFGGTGNATYDSTFGLILFVTSTGTFIDNISNVGPGSITPLNTNFTTNGATTANTGAEIKSLIIAGHTVTLTPTNAAQVGNNNTPIDTLTLSSGNLTSQTAASTITAGSATFLKFGASGATLASITTNTDLAIGANVTPTTSGGLTKAGAGVLTINGTNNMTGAYNVTAGTLTLNSAATVASLTGAAGTTVNNNAGISLNGTSAGTFTHAGTMAGTGALSTAAGHNNVQVLSGANGSYTGAMSISSGTIVAANAGAFGPAARPAVSVTNGGTMGVQGTITLNAFATTLNGAGASGRAGALDNISGSNIYNGAITLGSASTIGATAGSLTLGGGVTGANTNLTANVATGATVTLGTVAMNIGSGTLTKTGGGVLVLPNLANTLGNTLVQGGTVQATADTDLGAVGNSFTLDGGGIRYGAATFAFNGARPLLLTANGGIVDNQAFTANLSSSFSGAGGIIKLGTGQLTLTAAQSYLGGTTVRQGELRLSATNQLATTGALVIGNALTNENTAFFSLNGFDQTVSSLTLVSKASGGAASQLVLGGNTLTVNGTIAMVDNAAVPGNSFPIAITSTAGGNINLGGGVRDLNVAGNNNPTDLTIGAAIVNGGVNYTGTPSVSNSAVASVLYNANNTYAGGTTVNRGTLTVANGVTMAGAAGSLAVNGATSGFTSLLVLNSAQTVGELSGTVVAGGSATINLAAAAANLSVNQSTNTQYMGVISGSGGLAKSGTGTLTLSGANTYTGTTTVNNGTLRIGSGGLGSTAAGSAVNVLTGAALGGSGTINGVTTLNAGSRLAPGNSIGTLTINNDVSFSGDPANSFWDIELNAVASNTLATADTANVDRLLLTGAGSDLNFLTSGVNQIQLNLSQLAGTFGVGPVFYAIATANAGSNFLTNGGAFDSSHFNFVSDFQAVNFQLQLFNNNLVLSFTPIPEPTAILLGCGLLALGITAYRRKTKSA